LFVVIYKVTQLFLQVVYKMPGAPFVCRGFSQWAI